MPRSHGRRAPGRVGRRGRLSDSDFGPIGPGPTIGPTRPGSLTMVARLTMIPRTGPVRPRGPGPTGRALGAGARATEDRPGPMYVIHVIHDLRARDPAPLRSGPTAGGRFRRATMSQIDRRPPINDLGPGNSGPRITEPGPTLTSRSFSGRGVVDCGGAVGSLKAPSEAGKGLETPNMLKAHHAQSPIPLMAHRKACTLQVCGKPVCSKGSGPRWLKPRRAAGNGLRAWTRMGMGESGTAGARSPPIGCRTDGGRGQSPLGYRSTTPAGTGPA